MKTIQLSTKTDKNGNVIFTKGEERVVNVRTQKSAVKRVKGAIQVIDRISNVQLNKLNKKFSF